MEYCDLTNTVGQKRILAICREIGMLESKLLAIRTAVLVLSLRYSQKMVDLIHKYGYRFELDPKSGQQYFDELNAIVKKSKVISIAIKQKRFEHDEMTAKFKQEKPTEEYFDDLLAALGRFMHTIIHANEVSVTEFVAIRNRFEKECQAMEREQEKMKRKIAQR